MAFSTMVRTAAESRLQILENMHMRTMAMLLSATVLVLSSAVEAAAQQLVRVAEVSTVGGFTVYDQKTTVWASLGTTGRIRAGYVLLERDYRGNGKLNMTGSLTAQETYDFWVACYNAAPWQYPATRDRLGAHDVPDIIVTYMGRYTQRIYRNGTATNLPMVSDKMRQFTDLNFQVSGKTAGNNLFVYEAQGGHAGFHRQIAVTQEGHVTDDSGFSNPRIMAPVKHKEGDLTVAQLNNLKRLVYAADWWNLSDFPGHPSWADGIDEQGSYYLWGSKKTVFGGYASGRTPQYQAILDEIVRLADNLP